MRLSSPCHRKHHHCWSWVHRQRNLMRMREEGSLPRLI
jgi:hypothetical protein